MAIHSIITDELSGAHVNVGIGNALAVGPAKPSAAYNATLGVDDTPVTIVEGKGGQSFCITGIILTGNKNIATGTDATVDIFEATADDLTTSLSSILTIPVARSAQTVITGILMRIPTGRFVIGKTSDDDVFVTVLGFYV